MFLLSQLRALSPHQRNAFVAAYLGWTLDAFDYFILVFVLKDVARDFHVTIKVVSEALFLTLAFRPVGALLFGMAADRFGRRIPLLVNVLLYSLIEMLSGFSPNLATFFALRALFGIAMGGEWGLGASLALESTPAALRGLLSGILQQGYPVGYLLATLLYRFALPGHNWRLLFFVGAAPALLSVFIRAKVRESPVWLAQQQAPGKPPLGKLIRQNVPLFVSMVLLMTAFNFMSHGTQDLYPTFLQVQRHFSPVTVSNIAIVYNLGALAGGIVLGGLSQTWGRRRTIMAAALLALPVVPLWAFSHSAGLLALGAFLMQFCVQGAWGVIPAHLSELSPGLLRGTFTGLAYQLGNLIASRCAPLQTGLAESHGGDYSYGLAVVIAVVLVAVAVVAALGREARGVDFGERAPA